MVSLEKVKLALNNLNNITLSTPLELIDSYSNLFSSNVYVKREDLQITRSFKIRGSFNKILSLSDKQKDDIKKRFVDSENEFQNYYPTQKSIL